MTRTHRSLTVAGIALAVFMSAMEGTVVATAMPSVVGSLGGIHLYGWVGAVYTLASVVVMPLVGKLSDSVGRKPVMLAGLAVFLAGSMWSGLATGMITLICARAIQGAGAGALQPVALTMVGDLYAPAERGRVQGLFGALWGFSGMVGPVLGGLIVRAFSWRWVFFVNVPFGILSGVVLAAAYHEHVPKRPHSLDVSGALLLAATVALLLLGTSGILPIFSLVGAVAFGLAFVSVERHAKEPIMPMSLFRQRVVGNATICSAILGAVMMGALLYLPLYAQALLKFSPTAAGLLITPMLVGWPLASTLSGRLLLRFGYRPLVRAGTLLIALASAALAWSTRPGGGSGFLGTSMFFLGVGLGLANTALLIAVQSSVPWHQRGVATASSMFARTIGNSVAAGALGAVLAVSLGRGVPPEIVNALVGPEHGRTLDASVLVPLEQSFAVGMHRIFLAVAAVAVVGFFVGLLFPQLKVAAVEVTPPAPQPEGGRGGLSV